MKNQTLAFLFSCVCAALPTIAHADESDKGWWRGSWRGEWKEEFWNGRCKVKLEASRETFKEEVKCERR
jgi:hypothetical protein